MFLESQPSLSITAWLLLILILLTFWILFPKRPNNYPPSPGLALPVIGHCHFLDKNPRKQFMSWSRKLGSIFSIQMGSIPVVVITGYDLIKEALIKRADYFYGRPDSDILTTYIPECQRGITMASGTIWKEQRTTALLILKKLGMGKTEMAEKISEEVSCYITELEKTKGEPSEIKDLTHACISNVICAVLRGKRYDLYDPKILRLLHMSSEFSRIFSSASIANFVPFLRFLPYDPFQVRKLLSAAREIMQFTVKMVEETQPFYDRENVSNFIFAYLRELDKKKMSGKPTELDEQTLTAAMDNFVVAGSETINSTLSWCLLYALHFPEKQERVFQEIMDQVGKDRMPNLSDKQNLKYLNAFIMETQRLSSVIPLNVPYRCTRNVTLGGYFIPKGTQIIPSLDSVLHDERIWGDPHTFRPERFLDGQGNLKPDERLIAFSIGRRRCLGQPLAEMTMFLFLSAAFQRFQFLPKNRDVIPPLDEVFGISAPPVSYEIRCVGRNG